MQEYALIGRAIQHSDSPRFFNAKFAAEGIQARYILGDLPVLSDLRRFLQAHPRLVGFNVTHPYKMEIVKMLHGIDLEARLIGAVNTVVVERGRWGRRQLLGHNTDIEGFRLSVEGLIQPHHRRALVLGTGGAARAVARAFKKMGIDVLKVSRRECVEGAIGYNAITPDIMQQYTIVVNATPVGMMPNVLVSPPIPYECLTPQHLCYDLIYVPEQTLFLKKAAAQGAVTHNGANMLLFQAQLTWDIWQQHL